MSGPLSGFRIVDLTTMISGPMATMMLGDQGADVIKVENPLNGGDYVRHGSNRRGEFSANFCNNNRNKRSVAINLKSDRGRELLLELARTADVFVQNFRPGVVERMGIGEAEVRKVRPDIVYVSISGFGHTGPFAPKPVYDPLIQAMSGLATVQAGDDGERPRLIRTIVPDKTTAITAAQAITAALLARERSGEGQHVRLAMLDAIVAFMWSSDMGSQTFAGNELPQQEAASFMDLIYDTADGHISVAIMSDKEWRGLAAAVERPELLDDPRFKTPALRDRNINLRIALTQEILLERPAAEWLERLEAHEVPCAPVLTRTDLLDHPQIAANETLMVYDHPDTGPLRQARPPARFSGTPSAVRHGAPRLGQHTAEVLGEIGIDGSRLEALDAAGVTASEGSERAEGIGIT